jgi:hypothetical protein
VLMEKADIVQYISECYLMYIEFVLIYRSLNKEYSSNSTEGF